MEKLEKYGEFGEIPGEEKGNGTRLGKNRNQRKEKSYWDFRVVAKGVRMLTRIIKKLGKSRNSD